MLTENNNLVKQAGKAKEETQKSGDLEYLQLETMGLLTEYNLESKEKSERDYLLEGLKGKEGVTVKDEEKGIIEFNGVEYTLSQLTQQSTGEEKAIQSSGLKEVTDSPLLNEENSKVVKTVQDMRREYQVKHHLMQQKKETHIMELQKKM